jgi:hypothetical protein
MTTSKDESRSGSMNMYFKIRNCTQTRSGNRPRNPRLASCQQSRIRRRARQTHEQYALRQPVMTGPLLSKTRAKNTHQNQNQSIRLLFASHTIPVKVAHIHIVQRKVPSSDRGTDLCPCIYRTLWPSLYRQISFTAKCHPCPDNVDAYWLLSL